MTFCFYLIYFNFLIELIFFAKQEINSYNQKGSIKIITLNAELYIS
jgi:hypothetical protein